MWWLCRKVSRDKSITNVLPRRSWRGHGYWAFRFLTGFHLCIFGKKPYSWGRAGERLGEDWSQQPDSGRAGTGTGPLAAAGGHMLLFLWCCSRWRANYSPQLGLLKPTNKLSGKPFRVKKVWLFLMKAFHPESLFSDSRDGRGESGGGNSCPVLFSNFKAVSWCFIFQWGGKAFWKLRLWSAGVFF